MSDRVSRSVCPTHARRVDTLESRRYSLHIAPTPPHTVALASTGDNREVKVQWPSRTVRTELS
jgi:hypothetical protein